MDEKVTMQRVVDTDRTGVIYRYNLLDIDETLMITIIEGVQKKRREYREDLRDPKFADSESQEFIKDHIRQMNDFLRETDRFVSLSEDGTRMEIRR